MSTSVVLAYDPTWRALEWAKTHCKSYITNGGVVNNNPPLEIKYFFGDERDAMWFALRWGSEI